MCISGKITKNGSIFWEVDWSVMLELLVQLISYQSKALLMDSTVYSFRTESETKN